MKDIGELVGNVYSKELLNGIITTKIRQYPYCPMYCIASNCGKCSKSL